MRLIIKAKSLGEVDDVKGIKEDKKRKGEDKKKKRHGKELLLQHLN